MAREKMDDRTKYFWTNFLQGLAMAVFLIFFIAGGLVVDEPGAKPDYSGAFSIVGFLSTIALIGKIAMEFTDRAYPLKKDD